MHRKISTSLVAAALLTTTLAFGQQPATAGTSGSARAAAVTYWIEIQTGNVSGAGTDADVYVFLRGTRGSSPSKGFELDSAGDDFERNSYRRYSRVLDDLGDITEICLWRNEAGLFDDWNVEFVRVIPDGNWDRERTATFNGWMPPLKWICRRAT